MYVYTICILHSCSSTEPFQVLTIFYQIMSVGCPPLPVVLPQKPRQRRPKQRLSRSLPNIQLWPKNSQGYTIGEYDMSRLLCFLFYNKITEVLLGSIGFYWSQCLRDCWTPPILICHQVILEDTGRDTYLQKKLWCLCLYNFGWFKIIYLFTALLVKGSKWCCFSNDRVCNEHLCSTAEKNACVFFQPMFQMTKMGKKRVRSGGLLLPLSLLSISSDSIFQGHQY